MRRRIGFEAALFRLNYFVGHVFCFSLALLQRVRRMAMATCVASSQIAKSASKSEVTHECF